MNIMISGYSGYRVGINWSKVQVATMTQGTRYQGPSALCCYMLQKPQLVLADSHVFHLTCTHVRLDNACGSAPTQDILSIFSYSFQIDPSCYGRREPSSLGFMQVNNDCG